MTALSTLLGEVLSDGPNAASVPVMRPLQAVHDMLLTQWELPPGDRPYPYPLTDEEGLLVLDGRPTLVTPHGQRELCKGELVAFGLGPDGSHRLINGTPQTVSFLSFSATFDRFD